MAFDQKRSRTFKWLEKIATKTPTGLKYAYNPYRGMILCRFGVLYAQNGYILADVRYGEFEHIGDECWMEVASYQDVNGKHLDTVEFMEAEKHPANDRLFSDMFIAPCGLHYDSTQPFNPVLIAECMTPFKINDISPVIGLRDEYLEFSGHNKDVSIRVLMIGERK